ncbi:MAG: DinB family protein [Flavobacteriaceae bacterium]|nr:DinB family protein [Flavobacteriaceae bacterium]
MNWTFDICLKNRNILEGFLNQFSLDELNKIPDGFNNNLIWNIAHVVVTQQLLVYGNSQLPMLVSDEMVAKYRKGTKAEHEVNQDEVNEIRTLLFSTLEKTQDDYYNGLFKNYTEYTVSTKSTLTNVEQALEFNNFHEGIHLGYILALKKSI